MTAITKRITVDPEICGGQSCIRGMRIRVQDVLDLLANDLTPDQILEELPDLEREDILACLKIQSAKSLFFNKSQARGSSQQVKMY